MKKESYVVDTSIVIERKVTELIKEKKISGKIIIPNAVLAELEHQANENQSEGFIGLNEIKELRVLAEQKVIELEYVGRKPTETYIRGARGGAIDDLIREIAAENNAVLLTGDRVQALVADATGIQTMLILPVSVKEVGALNIEKFFDEQTMSVHLKENVIPLAKKGKPGAWSFTNLQDSVLSAHEIRNFASDIIEKTKLSEGAFIEISGPGLTVVQFKNYRIVIAKPPFADGWELTAVRPVASLEIDNYTLSQKLLQRLKATATGILIAGAPGSGKTTFAAALAKFYLKQGKIVKTIESPRDLQVPDAITQYSKNLGTRDDIHNVMLLTRPDYTIFDEMRTTEDFKLYADLRLAGIGLAGVVHATGPIDAAQRFVGRVELGMIPQVFDTIVFIKDGQVNEILDLVMKVKMPTGMMEADLARPVIEVRDFETGELEFEMYVYGEQTVVIPVRKRVKTKSDIASEENIAESLRKKLGFPIKVEQMDEGHYALYVPQGNEAKVIGRKGERISKLEQDIGVHIDVRTLEEVSGLKLDFKVREEKKFISFYFAEPVKSVELQIDGKELAILPVDRAGQIKLHKKSKLGRQVAEALREGLHMDFMAKG